MKTKAFYLPTQESLSWILYFICKSATLGHQFSQKCMNRKCIHYQIKWINWHVIIIDLWSFFWLLFKVNHPKFDNAENLTSLTYLNESGCLHTLRQRYGGNLVNTYAGNSLIVVKPKHQLNSYTQQVRMRFTMCIWLSQTLNNKCFFLIQQTIYYVLTSR